MTQREFRAKHRPDATPWIGVQLRRGGFIIASCATWLIVSITNWPDIARALAANENTA